ncbi:DUF305 domain-containing protein [Vulcanococcus sp.]|jgi:uncharacterized protein (DUF305 family)|uniref:DUF305 domain-containing protein n=1 Tax=Vulcanococcus sp. TaxID=2856995 RepID=UPI003BFC2843
MGLLFSAATSAVLFRLPALAQSGHEHHHHGHGQHAMPMAMPAGGTNDHGSHSSHGHDVGPAGSTYDLRWIDAMVQHHTGALRMSEFVFNVGAPGVGALANTIWADQAIEIKAMGQWRKAWYPEAPIYPVVLRPGGDPNAMEDLIRMSAEQIAGMRMMGSTPTAQSRVTWFLEGMLEHHGAALQMARDALEKSKNPTILLMAQEIILAQQHEIIQLRGMLRQGGLHKPSYYQFDELFWP